MLSMRRPPLSFGQRVLAGHEAVHAVGGRCVFFVTWGAVAAFFAIVVATGIEPVHPTIISLF